LCAQLLLRFARNRRDRVHCASDLSWKLSEACCWCVQPNIIFRRPPPLRHAKGAPMAPKAHTPTLCGFVSHSWFGCTSESLDGKSYDSMIVLTVNVVDHYTCAMRGHRQPVLAA